MTAEQIRLAMENKLEYLMEVKPQLASDDQLYKAAALVLRDLIRIFHPELVSEDFYYYRQVE